MSIANAEIDRILSVELGRLGGIGARWVARLMPINVGEHEFVVSRELDWTRRAVSQVLHAMGRSVTLTHRSFRDGIAAITPSGILGLNPAVVVVWTPAQTSNSTRVRVVAYAKEGLIKQRGGEEVALEAVQRIRALEFDTGTDGELPTLGSYGH